MSEFMVSGVITNEENHVLLMHRSDHNQWELPGGRVEEGEFVFGALERTLHDDLGLRLVGAEELCEEPQSFTQGGLEYNCHWFRVTHLRGNPFIVQSALYDSIAYRNLFGYNLRKKELSPNTNNFRNAVTGGTMNITIDKPTVTEKTSDE